MSSTVGGVSATETINATNANEYTTDSLTFEGQNIAETVGASGDTDAYGRAYTLNGTTLNITGATNGD